MKSSFMKLCSLVLTLVILLQMVPVAALGAEDTTLTDKASSVNQTEGAFVLLLDKAFSPGGRCPGGHTGADEESGQKVE